MVIFNTMKINSRYVIAGISLILIGLTVYYLSDILIYMSIAWVISMMGAPIVKFLGKYVNSTIAASITLVVIVGLFVLLIRIFIPPLIEQTRNLADIDYNSIVDSLEEPLNDWENWLIDNGLMDSIPDTVEPIIDELNDSDEYITTQLVDIDSLVRLEGDSSITSNITLQVNVLPPDDHTHAEDQIDQGITLEENIIDQTKKSIGNFLNPSRVTKVFGSIFGFFSNFLIAFMSILFISFFFLKEQGLVDRIITSIVPDKQVGHALSAMDESTSLLVRYFLGIMLQVTVITLFVSIFLSVFGVKNALLIGFFAALMNIIPYLGPLFGAAFAIIITVSSNLDMQFYTEMLPLLAKVIGVFAVMQMLDNFMLQPTIFSRSVKAHPLEIFIIVLIGAKFGGVIGMVLAIPAYTVFRVIAKIFLSEFKVIQSITKSIS